MSNTIIFSTAVFIISLLLCLLPRSLGKIGKIRKFYPHVTVFAAGFMLAMLLLDFIPHVAGICKHGKDHDHHSANECINPLDCNLHKESVNKEDMIHHSEHHEHLHDFFTSNLGFLMAGFAFILLLGIDSLVLHHSHCDNEMIVQMNDGLNHGAHDHSHMHDQIGTCNTTAIKESKSKIQAVIFILALSLHSFFEGLAISEQRKFGIFEIGLIIHKMLESFALGFTIHLAKFTFAYSIGLITVYSMLTPIGIAISNFFPSNRKFSAVCNGLALGSLLFIVCVEMIPPNFHSKKNDLSKIIMLCSGYVLTAIIIYLGHK